MALAEAKIIQTIDLFSENNILKSQEYKTYVIYAFCRKFWKYLTIWPKTGF